MRSLECRRPTLGLSAAAAAGWDDIPPLSRDQLFFWGGGAFRRMHGKQEAFSFSFLSPFLLHIRTCAVICNICFPSRWVFASPFWLLHPTSDWYSPFSRIRTVHRRARLLEPMHTLLFDARQFPMYCIDAYRAYTWEKVAVVRTTLTSRFSAHPSYGADVHLLALSLTDRHWSSHQSVP